ncbi:MAG: Phenylalanine-tRNA ligase beta subunit [Parcubacteria group bacterium GW2011_GWB1_55_9]|nr:MAG: Phenylalanine-tRNA ligase beta subunit [Parcubacteria group bacterium GW2011_GWB1_55_9]
MKVSLKWLQTYFDAPLPPAEQIADALTFHAFEIEEIQGDMLDVKVLPNRAADCLSHRGIAKELSAILDIPLTNDPLRRDVGTSYVPTSLTVEIEDPKKCSRYMGALVKRVRIGPSPAWLKKALESVGQRSINNIVDATNYVMLNIGQPLHAFDARRLKLEAGCLKIGVRNAKQGEQITTLSGEAFALNPSTLLITDENAGAPIALAGVKGGNVAELTAETTDLVVESANFDGTSVRKTAQTLKLPTDASQRFQNRPSPELCAYGMRDVLALITDIAGGEVVGVVDEYPARPETKPVLVTLACINGVLGSSFSRDEVLDVCTRLGLETKSEGDSFTITPPFERTDLTIPEDFAEEVGRILGYDRIPAAELPPTLGTPDQSRYRGIERMKDQLVEQGFTEVSTQSFAKKGDILLANPLDKTKPALRTSLEQNLQEAFARAKQYAPLVLAPNQKPKLFEVGTVFQKDGEKLEVKTSEPVSDLPEIRDDANYVPKRYELGAYKPFSVYPFIVRDISAFSPETGEMQSYDPTQESEFEKLIQESAGPLLIRIVHFDAFQKGKRISYPSRLTFQSMERTLTDGEVNGIMEKVSAMLHTAGYEVR